MGLIRCYMKKTSLKLSSGINNKGLKDKSLLNRSVKVSVRWTSTSMEFITTENSRD